MPAGDGVSVGSIFGRLGYRFDDSGSKEFEQSRRKHEQETQKPIVQPLGFEQTSAGTAALAAYHRELDKVRARTTQRDAFKAQLGADFDPRAFRAYEAELRKAEQARNRFDDQQRRSQARSSQSSLPGPLQGHFSASGAVAGFRGVYQQAGKIVFGGLAAQGLSAGLAGGGALAAGAAPLAGGLAAYPALAGAAAQGLGVFKLATEKVFPVVGGLNTQLDKNTKAFKELTPEAQRFAEQLEHLKKPLRDLPTIAQKGLLPGLEDGIKSLEGLLPIVKVLVGDTAKALGQLAREGGSVIATWGPDLQKQGERNVKWLREGGSAAIALADAARNVTLAAGPMVDWMVRGATAFAHFVDQQTSSARESGKLAAFFDQTRLQMSRVVRIAADLGTALVNIGKQAYPLGSDLLRVITLNAEKFKDWTASATGRNAIAEFFARARPALDELGRLLVDVTKTFFRLGNGQQVAPLLKVLRTELLPALEQVLTSTTTAFGPAFLNTLTQALLFFSHIAGSSGPLVEFTKLMGSILTDLNHLIDRFPALGTALSAIVALGGIAKALQLTAALTGVTRLIGLLKSARTVAAGAAVAETAGGAAGAAGAGAGAAAGAGGLLGRFGGAAAIGGAAGGAGLGIAALGGVKATLDAIRGGRASDLGLLNGYATAIERVAKAGDAGGMRKLADQLRETARVNSDLTRGNNLKAFADILDKTADAGGKDLSALSGAFDRLGKHTKSNLDDAGAAIRRLVSKSSPDFKAVQQEADDTAKRFKAMRDFTGQSLTDINTAVKDNMARIQSRLKSDSAAGTAALADNFEQAIKAVKSSMDAGKTATRDGLRDIRSYVAQELGVYGISFSKAKKIAGQGYTGDDAFRAAGRGQGEGHAGGGWIGQPGMVAGDTVPAMLAPGEAVLNRHQQAVIEGLLGGGFLDQLFANVTTPHYMASGGRASGGLQPAVASLASRLDRMFGLVTTSTTGGQHAPGSYHYSGLAADLGGPAVAMGRASQYLMSSGLYRSLLEGIHNPGLSVKDGKVVPSSFWGGAWAQHANHIHIALRAIGQALGGSSALGSVPIPKITGGGAIGRLAQAALGLVGGGANRLLTAAGAGLGGADTVDITATGRRAATSQVRAWVAAGLRLAGIPTGGGNVRTVASRAMQESGGDPTIVNTWDVNAQHGDPSIGLMQTTGSTFRRYMVRGHGNIRNPIDNVAAAVRYMLARYGHLVGAGPGGYARGGWIGGVRRFFAKGGRPLKGIPAPKPKPLTPTQQAIQTAAQRKDATALTKRIAAATKKGQTAQEAAAAAAAAGAAADAAPHELDFIDAAIAEASLTDTLDDDKSAYQQLVGYDERALATARASGDPRLVSAAANALKSARDALASLVATVTPDMQAQLDQANQRAQVAELAAKINASALSSLSVFDPMTGFSPNPARSASNAGIGAAGFNVDLGGGMVAPAGASITVLNVNTLHPGDSRTLRAISGAATAGFDAQSIGRATTTTVGPR